MTLPAFLKKGLSEKLPTFFEKKVGQKTLVGCAANSGAGSGIYAGCAANSGAGASQLKVFARLFQKAAGETAAKAPCGFWPPSRAEPLSRAAALIKARPAHGPQDTRSDAGLSPSKIRDRRRAAGMDFASTRFPAFLKKGFGEKLSGFFEKKPRQKTLV
ncbi:hypothetical protein, partial [Anaerotruncus colihominis]